MLKTRRIYLEDLIIDETIQPRAALNRARIEDFADAYREGATLPAPEVHEIAGKLYLCDGFHRVAGAIEAGRKSIEALVIETSTRARLLIAAVKANAIHGQPLTRQERRNAVIRIVEVFSANGWPWTQEEVGKMAGYTQSQVSRILAAHFGKDKPKEQELDRSGLDAIIAQELCVVNERARKNAAVRELPEAPTQAEKAMQEHVERARAHTDWMVAQLKELRRRLRIIKGMECGSMIAPHADELDAALDTLLAINRLRPVGICKPCRARGCEGCQHRGWITRSEA